MAMKGEGVMARKLRIACLLVAACVAVSFGENWEWMKNFRFREVKPIVMIDPLLHTFGVCEKEESAVRMITLSDLVNVHGHLCPGVLGSFLIPRAAIGRLYEDGEVPRVGDITMTTPSAEGLYADVALVLRFENDDKHGPQTWFIDKETARKDTSVFFFKRLSDSDAVEISVDMKAFIGAHTDLKSFFALKSKVLTGDTGEKDVATFRKTVTTMVDDLYRNREKVLIVKGMR
jgi:hypothetical protein